MVLYIEKPVYLIKYNIIGIINSVYVRCISVNFAIEENMINNTEIPIGKLKPGMVIGKSIEDRLGCHLIEPGPKGTAAAASSITDDLLNAIEKNNAVALNINALKCSDEYTFKHSVDVATISMVIAKEQGKTKKEIFEIGMAGLVIL